MNIFGKEITKESKPLYVAEISCNHKGNIGTAKQLISAAHTAGADFVKIQVYTPDEMTLNIEHKNFYISEGLWKNQYLYDLYVKTHTPHEWVPELFKYAKNNNINLFASVFGPKSLEVCEKAGCQAYKISSFEFKYLELVEKVINTRKPTILSTGLNSVTDILDNFNCFNHINKNIFYMHCVNKYPCKIDMSNLSRINLLQDLVGKDKVGYSDHTQGIVAAKLAVAMGAKIIEKHFRLAANCDIHTEDHEFSATPFTFNKMVRGCNEVYEICNGVESEYNAEFKRDFFAVKPIKKGKDINIDDISMVRSAVKKYSYLTLNSIVEHKAKKDINVGDHINKNNIDWKK